ncbi:MAG: DUF1080 domain-containing protein [Planctomycetales bacterium]|nr:DUF1080 domain-containing protein [Planctomycetales bacterium]
MTHSRSARLLSLFTLSSLTLLAAIPVSAGEWESIFNGKNLDGWTVKIRHHELGDNFADTFRVADGAMQVRYDAEQYGEFKERFGHIFYKTPYSHYRLRLEYRFVGDQVQGGPGWATRNSGIMVHGQDPKTMTKDQDFPVSIEVQLLGGDGKNKRTTGNLCTPGTNVVMDDKLVTRHCTSADSQTYHGEQWVKCEVEVHGDQIIRHWINGEKVLEYRQPQLDDRDENARKLIVDGQKLLQSGTISLQSESHPCDFRNIEIMVLDE